MATIAILHLPPFERNALPQPRLLWHPFFSQTREGFAQTMQQDIKISSRDACNLDFFM